MAEFKDFNASKLPGTCLWCGQKLRKHYDFFEKLGPYNDGYFCSLRCGYQFGEKMARWGERFAPKDSD